MPQTTRPATPGKQESGTMPASARARGTDGGIAALGRWARSSADATNDDAEIQFQRDMKLEGDVLVMMQNLRCFTRQIELLRVVGVPV